MKNRMKDLMVKFTTILLVSVMVMGCAEQKVGEGQDATTPVDDTPVSDVPADTVDTQDSLTAHWDEGATAALSIVGSTATRRIEKLIDFAGVNLNTPSDVQINIALEPRGDGWGGQVMVGFNNEGSFYEYTMVNGDTDTYSSTSLVEAAKYNIWFDHNGDAVWHGFFQDNYGGIVVIFDQIESPGDGQPPTTLSGSVWFKNLGNYEGYEMPTKHCWFISIGPNDCRAWKSGNEVNTYAALEPDSGYIKLGTFSGLSIAKAFGEGVVVP